CLRTKDESKDTYTYKVADLASGTVLALSVPTEPSSRTAASAPVWDELGRTVYFTHNGELWRGDVFRGVVAAIARIPGRQIVDLVTLPTDRLWQLRNEFALVITHDENGKQDGLFEVNLKTGNSRKLMENGQCYTCVFKQKSIVVSRNGEAIV